MTLRHHLNKFEAHKTPFYHYDLKLLRETLDKVKALADKFDFNVHYAVKANSNPTILNEILGYGFGADCVSGNEVKTSAEVGFDPQHILFAGVGKTDEEIELALDLNIKSFNCESAQEIEVINDIATRKGRVAEISLRINPNVDAKTHRYITTGLEENKFGINQQDFPLILDKLVEQTNVRLTGIHFHIGSQITDLNVFKGLCLRVNEFTNWFESRGVKIEHINLGGGLGIDYMNPDACAIPDFDTYFGIFAEFLERRADQQVHFELGRAIVGQCGNLISRVVFIKSGLNTHFAILDAGMTELMRPALYQSYHQIENLSSSLPEKTYDVVGPICESTDCFGKAVSLPETSRGDIVALRSAGAYGEVMVSRYNLRTQNSPVFTE